MEYVVQPKLLYLQRYAKSFRKSKAKSVLNNNLFLLQ